MKDNQEYTTCPRCLEETLKTEEGRNALSRRDNDTLICSACGEEEAFIDAELFQFFENPRQALNRDIKFKMHLGRNK